MIASCIILSLLYFKDNRSPIKPDPMTVKQVLGGNVMSQSVFGMQSRRDLCSSNESNVVIANYSNIMGLSASLGLSPQLLQSLGVVGM